MLIPLHPVCLVLEFPYLPMLFETIDKKLFHHNHVTKLLFHFSLPLPHGSSNPLKTDITSDIVIHIFYRFRLHCSDYLQRLLLRNSNIFSVCVSFRTYNATPAPTSFRVFANFRKDDKRYYHLLPPIILQEATRH